MSKVTFEFDGIEEQSDITLCNSRYKLLSALSSINEYRRTLYKYEERKEIPTEEVENKLNELLGPYYEIESTIE